MFNRNIFKVQTREKKKKPPKHKDVALMKELKQIRKR